MDDFSFLDLIWTIFIIYALVFYLVLLFRIVGDLFRDRSTSGLAKAGWVLFFIIVPIISVLVYLIARGQSMSERSIAAHAEAQREFDDHIRDVSGTDAPSQISRAKDLLDSGAIDQSEFDALKQKALST